MDCSHFDHSRLVALPIHSLLRSEEIRDILPLFDPYNGNFVFSQPDDLRARFFQDGVWNIRSNCTFQSLHRSSWISRGCHHAPQPIPTFVPSSDPLGQHQKQKGGERSHDLQPIRERCFTFDILFDQRSHYCDLRSIYVS